MRRALSIAVAAAAVTIMAAAHAGTARASDVPARLTVATVPSLAGVRFSLDGRTFVTGNEGRARIETTHGHHLLRILDTSRSHRGVRSTFVRWGDSTFTPTRRITIGHDTVIQAGFQQSVRVRFGFADGAGRPVLGRVSRMTLTSTLGSRLSFTPAFPRWLPASAVARRFNGLQRTLVQYSVEQALVSGSNVVNKSQQRFYPAQTRKVTVHLLLYSARISVHDFVFGTASGSTVDLIYPNGTRLAYPLKGGTLRLTSMPRGTYQIEAQAGGYVPKVSLALSRDQVLDVKVVSYLDMLLFFVLAAGTVSALILIPRPYLRLRLRSVGSGKHPTPDDLEPPKPLSGARKQLIHRYMTDADEESGVAGAIAARVVRRLPAPVASAAAAPATGSSSGPRLRMFPSRLRAATAERLRGFAYRFRGLDPMRLRPGHESPLSQEVLTGERIELIHVYMGEEAVPARPAGSAAQPPRAPAPSPSKPSTARAAGRPLLVSLREARGAAARAAGRAIGLAVGVLRAWAGRLRTGFAALRPRPDRPALDPPALRPRAALQPGPAPEPAPEPRPAPAEKRPAAVAQEPAAAASRPSTPPPAQESAAAAEQETAPAAGPETAPAAAKPTAAPTTRKRAAAPRKKTAAAKPKQKRAPARKKPSTATKSKRAAAAKEKPAAVADGEDAVQAKKKPPAPAKPKPGAKPKTEPAARRPAAKTQAAEEPATQPTGDHGANGGPNGGPNGGRDLAVVHADLAAAVEALQDDLRKARAATTKQGRKSQSKAGK